MEKHSVSTVFEAGRAFTSSINQHKLLTDAGIADGGNDAGPGPKRLMLVALAGCTGIDIVSILTKMKVLFTDLSIDTEATLTEASPKIYNHVDVTYKIKLAVAEQVKMEKAVALSADKHCGVMAMFKTFAKVETHIVYL